MNEESKNEFQENLSKTIHTLTMCCSCVHKDVCKFSGNVEKCENFLCSNDPSKYGHIYTMFEPIFQWMQIHYPSDKVYFVVDRLGAQMYQDHGPFISSEKLKKPLSEVLKEDNLL